MAPTYSAKDNKLIHELLRISKNNPKLIKSSEYVAPEAPEMTIRSWKMNEFKYYDVPSPFPTLARGLFTTEADEGGKRSGREKEYRIVIRGYDKFFNIGEVPWTTVCHTVLDVGSLRLTKCVAVGVSRSAYSCPLHALVKIKRLYHLHRRP